MAQKANGTPVNDKLFKESIEKSTWKSFQKTKDVVTKSLNSGKATQVLDTLAEFTPPMTSYFDEVLVMDNDKKIRTNRLAFLKECDSLYQQCANFELISV